MKKMKNKIDWTKEEETWYDETNNYLYDYEKFSQYTLSFNWRDKYTIGYRNKDGDIYIYNTNSNINAGKCEEILRIDGTKNFYYMQTDGGKYDKTYPQFRKHIGEDIDIVIVKYRTDKIRPSEYKLANYNGHARRVPHNELLEVVVELGDVSQYEENGVVTVDHKIKNEKITKVNRIEEMII